MVIIFILFFISIFKGNLRFPFEPSLRWITRFFNLKEGISEAKKKEYKRSKKGKVQKETVGFLCFPISFVKDLNTKWIIY